MRIPALSFLFVILITGAGSAQTNHFLEAGLSLNKLAVQDKILLSNTFDGIGWGTTLGWSRSSTRIGYGFLFNHTQGNTTSSNTGNISLRLTRIKLFVNPLKINLHDTRILIGVKWNTELFNLIQQVGSAENTSYLFVSDLSPNIMLCRSVTETVAINLGVGGGLLGYAIRPGYNNSPPNGSNGNEKGFQWLALGDFHSLSTYRHWQYDLEVTKRFNQRWVGAIGFAGNFTSMDQPIEQEIILLNSSITGRLTYRLK